jgi:hypothetical protein
MSGYVTLVQDRTCYVRLCHFMSGYVWLLHVWAGYQFLSGCIRLGQVSPL